MKKIRHVLRREIKTKNGIIVKETNVYYPKSKIGKIETMGPDYSYGSTYKKTNNDGTFVSFGYGDKNDKGYMFIPAKDYKVQNKKYIKGGKK